MPDTRHPTPDTPDGSLRAALGMRASEIVSIVGGGGKTTILYRLGDETAAAGGRAVLTGTTRFTPREGAEQPETVFGASEDSLRHAVRQALDEAPIVVAGAGWGNKGRILPVEPAWLAGMAALPGVMAVVAEADGSAGRAFKAPAEHEPVVADSTTLLIAVVGIDVLEKPLLAEHVHRPEIVARLARAELGDPVSEDLIARVLLHPLGGRKSLPAGARWIPVLNKVESAGDRSAARRIAELLLAGGAGRVVITRAAHDPPVVEVLT
jgi:molybdenum cofactor cytidylyltransferase